MDDFKINVSETFDKFHQEKRVYSSVYVFSKYSWWYMSATYVSNPEEEYIEFVGPEGILLLDEKDRIDIGYIKEYYDSEYQGYKRKHTKKTTIKEFKRICDAKKIEMQEGCGKLYSKDVRLFFPIVRSLYNAAIRKRYPENEIRSMFELFAEQQIEEERRNKEREQKAEAERERKKWRDDHIELLICIGVGFGVLLLIFLLSLLP